MKQRTEVKLVSQDVAEYQFFSDCRLTSATQTAIDAHDGLSYRSKYGTSDN